MQKIAVCIPSFNEKDNIENITHEIDLSLNLFDKNIEAIIVNCDNNSPDKTNDIFNRTYTEHQKVSIVTDKKGKGQNIYNFLKFSIENDVDYGFMIDADLKSFKLDWLPKMYECLINGSNFVLPLYKRRKEEGNTTNHFVSPMIYDIYGKFIRQPIGGDYALDSKYMKTIMKEQFTQNIMNYGIDVFMVVTAIIRDCSINEVYLGEKIHAPSYNKMDYIFESVLRGFSEVFNHYPTYKDKEEINYHSFIYDLNHCEFRQEMENKFVTALSKCNLEKDYMQILNYWESALNEYKSSIRSPSNSLIEKLKNAFICRSVSFWDEMDSRKEKEWENVLINEIYLKEKYEITNKK